MSSNLFNVKEKKTAKQAIVFYLFYLVLGLVLGAIFSGSMGVTACIISDNCETYEQGVELGKQVGTIAGLVFCFVYTFVIGLWIILSRGLLTVPKAVILYVLAILLALPLGALFALIPLAFLTTIDNAIFDDNIQE